MSPGPHSDQDGPVEAGGRREIFEEVEGKLSVRRATLARHGRRYVAQLAQDDLFDHALTFRGEHGMDVVDVHSSCSFWVNGTSPVPGTPGANAPGEPAAGRVIPPLRPLPWPRAPLPPLPQRPPARWRESLSWYPRYA